MHGPPKLRRLDEPVAVSLEALVPRDRFYRHLEAKLDLSFVRARDLYSERGRPSIDPIVFFMLQLVMFFEGIRSERKLVACRFTWRAQATFQVADAMDAQASASCKLLLGEPSFRPGTKKPLPGTC